MRSFVPGVISPRDIEAQRVVIAEVGDTIATVKPGGQLNAAVKLHLITQLGFLALQHFKSLINRHRGRISG
jgi:hypothetical protein